LQADRAPGAPHGEREIRLDGHVLLAAEAAPDVRRDHAHPRLRDAEDPGHVAEVLHDLCRDPEVQHALVIQPADACLRLQVGVINCLGLVRAIDDDVGGSEGIVHAAAIDVPLAEEIARNVDGWRTVGQRFCGVEDAGQFFVVDVHELAGFRESLLAVGHDQGDRLAVEADPARREHFHAGLQRGDLNRLARDIDPDDVVWHVLPEKDANDAGDSSGGRPVPSRDLRRWHRGAHQTGVQHAGEREIPGITGAARDLLLLVMPRQGLAHDPQLLRLGTADLRRAHRPRSRCAASTASTIGP